MGKGRWPRAGTRPPPRAQPRGATVLRVLLVGLAIVVIVVVAGVVGTFVTLFTSLGQAREDAETTRARSEAALREVPGVESASVVVSDLGKSFDHRVSVRVADGLAADERSALAERLGEAPTPGQVTVTVEGDDGVQLQGHGGLDPGLVDWWYDVAAEVDEVVEGGDVRCDATGEVLACAIEDGGRRAEVRRAVAEVDAAGLQVWLDTWNDRPHADPRLEIVIGADGPDPVRVTSVEQLTTVRHEAPAP